MVGFSKQLKVFNPKRKIIFINYLFVFLNSFIFFIIFSEPSTTVFKQVPVGYFRTYTYQPLSYPQQNLSPLQSYQIASRVFPNMMQQNNWRQFSQSPVNPFLPSGGSPSMTAGHPQMHSIPPTSPTNPPMPSFSPSMPTTPSQSDYSPHVMPHTLPPPQQMNFGPSSSPSSSPLRQSIYSPPDPLSLQYITNVAPINVQHVQFVPCMCPVTVTVSSSDVADKRSDEITSESNDSISVLAQDDKM